MNKEIFSYYRPPISSATIPTETLTLRDVWERIRTDSDLHERTEELRTLILTDGEEAYRTRKRETLPSVTFGGVFDYRSRDSKKLQELGRTGLLSLSGYITIDIDHISQTGLSLEELRDKLSRDRGTGVRLIFVSPSGDGLKLVCKSATPIRDSSHYEEVFQALRHYINSGYSGKVEIVDKSGKDVTRLCLLPFDGEAILKDWGEAFHPELHPVPKPETSTLEDYADLLREWESQEDGVEALVRRVEESGLDIAPEYPDYLPLVYSFTALGERGRSLLHRVCRYSPKYSREDTDRDWEECCKSTESQSIGYFVNLCKKAGIDVSQRPRRESGIPALQAHGKTSSQTPRDRKPEESPEERKQRYNRDFLTIHPLREIASQKKEGLPTGYQFKDSQGRTETLVLPSGALTLICGRSSHGKTRLLQNLSLQIAKAEEASGGEGVVLYFSFEESLLEVAERVANIAVNKPQLSQYGTKNTEVLRDYFQTGTLNKSPEAVRTEVSPRLSEFESLYNSGRLRIYYTPDLYSGDLCRVLEYLSSRMSVKAVFLDYVQAIYKEGNRKDRKDELREICKEINDIAISLDIPIVLSAQLNRETPNPTDMSGDNIAESADITRYANTILLLWDSSKARDIRGGLSSYLNTAEGKRLQERGFRLGERGKLYAVLSKNRGGTPDVECILDYVPETGKVLENEDLPEDTPGGTDNVFNL